jgi:cell division protein FtsQ
MANKAGKISLLLLLIIVCIYLFMHSSIFDINKVNVSGQKEVTSDEVKALAGITPGENLFKINRLKVHN